METILQGLMELGGVSATMVLDARGAVVGHRAHAVYDRATCEQVGGTLTKAIESVQLQQEDWESITAQYADGKILLRKLGAGPSRHVLAVVADATLNASFATVAIRVAANKLRSAIEGGASVAGTQPPGAASGLHPSASSPLPKATASSSLLTPADSRPMLSNTGLSWSKSSNVGSQAGGISGVSAADPASAAFLTRCAKALARHVGPMAKIYVQEAVRRVSPEAPFSLAMTSALLDDVAGQIEDEGDRADFRKAIAKG
jgi:predicted regulator of Ras-like GTPase activity (Roadblock/LC7/MglB family)